MIDYFYKALTERVQELGIDLTHIDMWNQQPRLFGSYAVSFPAVFFEFADMSCQPAGDGTEFGEMLLRVYVIFNDKADSRAGAPTFERALSRFKFLAAVHKKLQRFTYAEAEIGGFNELVRRSFQVDSDFADMPIYISEYQANWQDLSQDYLVDYVIKDNVGLVFSVEIDTDL